MTSHYSPEDWADLARNTATPDAADDMKRHLAGGCQSCAELHDGFRAVFAVSSADAAYEPPAADLHMARAFFALRTPEAPRRSGVTLLFDSLLAGATAGLRSPSAAPRKFLFASGDMVIDLQVTPDAGRHATIVVGQVTMASHADRRVAGLPALLHRRMQRVAKTTTNDHGEFELEFDGPAEDLTLALGSDPDPTIITLGTFSRDLS